MTQIPTPPSVAFIGAGPGDLGLVTARASQLLARAQIVVLDAATARDVAVHHCHPDAELVTVDTPGGGAVQLQRAVKHARAIVRLLPGAGVTFPELADEIAAVRKAGADVELVPGVSPVSAVPAYAGLVPTGAWGMHIVLDAAVPWQAGSDTAPLTGEIPVVVHGALSQVLERLEALRKAGRDANTSVVLTTQGTTVDQQTYRGALSGVRAALAKRDGTIPAVAVLMAATEVDESTRWFDKRALFGWRVVVPCTQQDVTGITERLAYHGAAWDLVPTISVAPPRTPAQMDRATQGLVRGSHGWVAFTSPHTVRAVRDRFENLGLDARVLAGVRVAAVAGATTKALQDWGIEPDLMPADDARPGVPGLADAWPNFDSDVDPVRGVLVLEAEVAVAPLVEALTAQGWEPDEVVAFRTVRAAPPPEAIRDGIKRGRYDAVLFSSSAAVRNLVGIAGKPHATTVIVCIGAATARTAEELGLRVDAIAESADQRCLVDALAEVGREMRAEALAEGREAVRPSDRVRRRS